ncbi:hypothetical protein O181_067720 [Austropuccinia psidii MF-1]|uniref:Uncharacterized protein n=1 Tax=Austropuccinia psidii MF-1 TaxID=1389203 RepID=A0A9Q3EZK0_9BASI|nr:hypothetical protein [Austropuccinia psidii MF-1]
MEKDFIYLMESFIIGQNKHLPQDLVEIHPRAASFKFMLEIASKHAVMCMEDSFENAKDKWEKSHAPPDFKVGDLVLLSTTKFNQIKLCKNSKDTFTGPFVIKDFNGGNYKVWI